MPLPYLVPRDDQEKDEFYETQNDTLFHVPPGEGLVVLGDFNARVGAEVEPCKGVLGRHGLAKMNEHGLRLLRLYSEQAFLIKKYSF